MRRPRDPREKKLTTVLIYKDQYDALFEKGINLSKYVRTLIDMDMAGLLRPKKQDTKDIKQ